MDAPASQAENVGTVDTDFVEKFMKSVNTPLDYGVYFLFHDFWENANQHAIDQYLKRITKMPEAKKWLEDKHIPEPLKMERLEECAPGTLGHGYRNFIIKNNLEANLGRNYKAFNEELGKAGKLKRLPEELSYMMVRGFQLHDFHHVLTGYEATYYGELAQASFYLAQIGFPYHAFRVAVTTAHTALLRPEFTEEAMDAFTDGWQYGREAGDINFVAWEEHLDTPVEVLRERHNLNCRRFRSPLEEKSAA